MIAIVDYRAGNLASVLRAVRRLGHHAEITDDPRRIIAAERVIFPGVGAAGETMRNLRSLGLDRVLEKRVFAAGKPLLGICIGIQVIFDHSEENDAQCLGLMPGVVKRFPLSTRLKVPHIGWNTITIEKPHPILAGVPNGAEFYFVNSYHPVPARTDDIYATAEYGVRFAAVVAHDNLVATQFHLEKSGRTGLKMLDNFCRWNGDRPC